jgi:hypothetical protein
MNRQQIIAAVEAKDLDCSYKSSTGEYRINLRIKDGGTEQTAYYTNDGEDALNTATAMAKRRDEASVATYVVTVVIRVDKRAEQAVDLEQISDHLEYELTTERRDDFGIVSVQISGIEVEEAR